MFAIALSIVFLAFILPCSFLFRQYPPGLPNGSFWNIPFLGQTWSFLRPHKSNSIGTFLQQNCSRYGKVFRTHLFGYHTIVSCDLELNLFILRNEEILFRNHYPKPLYDVLGRLAMMLTSGELHKRLRGAAVGFINNAYRSDFISTIDEFFVKFIDSLKAKEHVFFFDEAKEVTFFLMLKVLANVEAEDPNAKEILVDFKKLMKGFVSVPIYIPGNDFSKAVKARRKVFLSLKELIKKRENAPEGTNSSGQDFLDVLVANTSLKDDEKACVLLDLLFGGYETTSALMALVVYFLSQSPAALTKLQEEHRALQKNGGEPLVWDDYKKMTFTSYVIHEALRCGNVVKFLHRKALKDVKFKKYVIPQGWQVIPVMAATHLDPSHHENPFEFNPWRWEDPSTIKKVTPFGGGKKLCPGAEIAKLEVAIFLHHFVQKVRWKTIWDDCPMSIPFLDFKGGLPLKIEELK